MATEPTVRGFNREEPIPGYRTVDLLGRGGCGEVWRAIAPGGIQKAIKIVFGDVQRADAELKSLERIKDCRHPMLLSIERIEVVEHAVIMVTELADESLRDRFNKLRAQEAVGIPQDELLKHLADVAEALDYLYDRFSLQHLDVKPENILLVGGRAKIGDFGLVKSLYERSASIVGGLTPSFAPPELFDGKPSRHSDQYSLAIVYMQMLTGVLPYSAGTMAQLATQHLRGVPDLTALPRRQHAVIARALSKDPLLRFENCMAMVQALRESAREPDVRHAPPRPEVQVEASRRTTVSTRPADPAATTSSMSGSRTKLAPPAETPDRTDSPLSVPPMIVIGVGGAGVAVVARLVTRLKDRYGAIENWPDVELMVLDTNVREMNAQFKEPELARVKVVPLPLKSAEGYAPRASDYLRWLNRRWFYNIPRDVSSVGFRPFGRLALLTHAKAVRETLRAIVASAVERGASAAPRVALISSLSGGTGSGAVLDLSYAVRSALKSQNLADDFVHGFLLHATGRAHADRDRGRTNAYAALTELNHFSRPGGCYPGESSLGALPFHGDNPTFGRTHVLHLGEGLDDEAWDVAIDNVAELVYCNSFTPAGTVFDHSLAATGHGAHVCGATSLGAGTDRIVDLAQRLVRNEVIRHLREGCPESDPSGHPLCEPTAILQIPADETRSSDAEIMIREALDRHRLDADPLVGDAELAFFQELGDSLDRFASKMVDEALPATKDLPDRDARVAAISTLIERFLHWDDDAPVTGAASQVVFPKLVARVGVLCQERVNGFIAGIRERVNARTIRVEGARRLAVEARTALQLIRERITAQAATLRARAATSLLEARGSDPPKPERQLLPGVAFGRKQEEPLKELLKPYARLRLREFLHRVAGKSVRIIDGELALLIEQFDQLSNELSHLAEPYQPGDSAEASGDVGPLSALTRYRHRLQELVRIRCPEVVRNVEAALDKEVLTTIGGLSGLLEPDANARAVLVDPLVETSRRILQQSMQEVGWQLIGAKSVSGVTPLLDVVDLVSQNYPAEPESAFRALVVTDNPAVRPLEARLEALPEVALIKSPRAVVTACAIGIEEPIGRIASRLISGITAYEDLAARVQTRTDLTWVPLSATDALPSLARQESVVEDHMTMAQTAAVLV